MSFGRSVGCSDGSKNGMFHFHAPIVAYTDFLFREMDDVRARKDLEHNDINSNVRINKFLIRSMEVKLPDF